MPLQRGFQLFLPWIAAKSFETTGFQRHQRTAFRINYSPDFSIFYMLKKHGRHFVQAVLFSPPPPLFAGLFLYFKSLFSKTSQQRERTSIREGLTNLIKRRELNYVVIRNICKINVNRLVESSIDNFSVSTLDITAVIEFVLNYC